MVLCLCDSSTLVFICIMCMDGPNYTSVTQGTLALYSSKFINKSKLITYNLSHIQNYNVWGCLDIFDILSSGHTNCVFSGVWNSYFSGSILKICLSCVQS